MKDPAALIAKSGRLCYTHLIAQREEQRHGMEEEG